MGRPRIAFEERKAHGPKKPPPKRRLPDWAKRKRCWRKWKRDGLSVTETLWMRAYQREWFKARYRANPEKRKAYLNAWRAANRAKNRAYDRAYRLRKKLDMERIQRKQYTRLINIFNDPERWAKSREKGRNWMLEKAIAGRDLTKMRNHTKILDFRRKIEGSI